MPLSLSTSQRYSVTEDPWVNKVAQFQDDTHTKENKGTTIEIEMKESTDIILDHTQIIGYAMESKTEEVMRTFILLR